jgi:hypothetical protein
MAVQHLEKSCVKMAVQHLEFKSCVKMAVQHLEKSYDMPTIFFKIHG